MSAEHEKAQANRNSVKQFLESPDLSDAVTDGVIGNQTSHAKMADCFFTDDRVKSELVKVLGELVYENLQAGAR